MTVPELTPIRRPEGVDARFVAKPTDVLSEREMGALLTDGGRALRAAEDRLTAAQRTFEIKTRRIYYNTSEAYEAAFEEHAGPLKAAEDEALTAAEALAQSAIKIRQQVQSSDRSNVMPDELAAANLVREYVREDCAGRPLANLAADIARALTANDRARLYNYQRYARARLDTPTAADINQPEPAAVVRAQLNQVDRLFADTSLTRYADQASEALGLVVRVESLARARHKEQARQAPQFTAAGVQKVAWPSR